MPFCRNLILLGALVLLGTLGACSEDPETKYTRLINEGAALFAEERYDDARFALSSAISIKPKEAGAYYQLAETLVRLKRFPEGIENYRTALNYNPEHREARLHLAALMIVVREYERADSDVRRLLERDPNDHDALVLSANLARARNNLAEARTILSTLLQAHPEDTTVLANLGDLELAEGHPDLAEEYFRRALKIEPNNNTVRLALADLYASEQRGDEAQALMEEVLKGHPANTTLRLYFGEFLLGRGQTGRAREQFEEMLKLDPFLRDTRDRLYDLYLAYNEPKAAQQLVADLKTIAPEDPSLPYFEGRNLELQGKRDAALLGYLQTIRVLSNFAPAFRRAGLVELSLGQVGPGHEHLNQAIAINPGDVGARLALARSAFLHHDFGEAQGHLAKIRERYPRHLAANVMRADMLLLEGKTKEARQIYNALIAAGPDTPIGHLKLALLEEREGNSAAAIIAYEKYLSFDKDVLVAARRLVRLIAKTQGENAALQRLQQLRDSSKTSRGEYQYVAASLLASSGSSKEKLAQARALLDSALQTSPGLIAAYVALAQLDAMEHNFTAAVARYQELLKREPRHLPALMLLGLSYEQLKQYAEAERTYRQALAISPQFAPAQNNLAWLLAEHLNGNLDEALELARSAKEKLPRESGVTDTLGWVYHKRGQSRAAVGYLEEALDLDRAEAAGPHLNPEILYHLGIAALATGETEKARTALTDALKAGGPQMSRADEIKKLLDTKG